MHFNIILYLYTKGSFKEENWQSENYTPLHAINDAKVMSLDILQNAQFFLLIEILTRNSGLSGLLAGLMVAD